MVLDFASHQSYSQCERKALQHRVVKKRMKRTKKKKTNLAVDTATQVKRQIGKSGSESSSGQKKQKKAKTIRDEGGGTARAMTLTKTATTERARI